MKIQSAVFETSASALANCPVLPLPEFAFIGRSNVGKSSLINSLLRKKDLAKVSDLPGKTRLMNFFTVNRNWRLVDLPGYGYAHGAKTESEAFNQAVATYLIGRDNLVCAFVLIDSRLPPQEIDIDFIEWLVENEIPFVLIFTKTDKQSASKTEASIARFTEDVLSGYTPTPLIFQSSSKTDAGRDKLLKFIDEQLADNPQRSSGLL